MWFDSLLSGFMLEQLGYGMISGLIGGWLLNAVHRRQLMAEPLRPLGLVALPLTCALLSEHFGASVRVADVENGLGPVTSAGTLLHSEVAGAQIPVNPHLASGKNVVLEISVKVRTCDV